MTDQLDAKASELQKAVLDHNTEASLILLESVGGACQARELAKKTSNLSGKYNSNMSWGLTIDATTNKETISVFKHTYSFAGADEFVAALTQDRCKK
ncbi:MAG TPA: hypothetical protein V6C81_28850 [Planktothrix sp.]|jgi:flagellar biosynthesis GTPase FlhF